MDVASIALIEDEDILLDLASLALSHLDHEKTGICRLRQWPPNTSRQKMHALCRSSAMVRKANFKQLHSNHRSG